MNRSVTAPHFEPRLRYGWFGLLLSMTLLVTGLSAIAAPGSRLVIKGVIFDRITGTPLRDVKITSEYGRALLTDSSGSFELVIEQELGEIATITFSKRGYLPLKQSFSAQGTDGPPVKVLLDRVLVYREEMTVEADALPNVEPSQMVAPEQVIKLPGAGEDALQTLKYMPGVTGADDFSSQLYVRGGRPDQNGIFLDGIAIYDPYRLFGLTTLFNPETLKHIKLYPGGFDVRYGDRLSAVIEVENRTGTIQERFAGSLNVSMTNTNLIAEGGLDVGFPASWLVSLRRTYYDVLLKQLDSEGSSFPSFFDMQTIIRLEPAPHHRWTLTVIGCDEGTDIVADEEVVSEQEPDHVELDDDQKNYVVGLNGDHLFGEYGYMNYVLAWTRSTQLSDAFFIEGDTQYESSFNQDLVTDVVSFKDMVELYQGDHSILGGVDLAHSDNTLGFNISTDDPNIDIPDALSHFSETQDFQKYGAFLQDTWEIIPDLELKGGVRWDRSTLSDMSAYSPRASIRWQANQALDVRLAWGQYYQFPSYESLQGDGFFLDLRDIKDLHLKPERAEHYVAGCAFTGKRGWELSADIYYKELDDLLQSGREAETILILDDNEQVQPYEWETYTFIPENRRHGFARGAELTMTLLEAKDRPYYGMLSYGYCESKSADERGWKWEYWDQRHTITLIGGWKLTKSWEATWKWRFASGMPYTPLTNVIRVIQDLDGDGQYEPEQGEFFSYRRDDPYETVRSRFLPAFHRLDLRVQYTHVFDRFDSAFYLDIINVYDQKNVFGYDYNEDYTERTAEEGMPFLPSLGVKLRF